MKLILYTTLGCHLCEQAREIVDRSKFVDRIQLEPTEISDSDELMERYGIRIPVIRVEGRETEIGWPFDSLQFDSWLAENLGNLSD